MLKFYGRDRSNGANGRDGRCVATESRRTLLGAKALCAGQRLMGRTQASGSGTKHEGHRAFYGTNGQFGQDGDWIAWKPRHTLERGRC